MGSSLHAEDEASIQSERKILLLPAHTLFRSAVNGIRCGHLPTNRTQVQDFFSSISVTVILHPYQWLFKYIQLKMFYINQLY